MFKSRLRSALGLLLVAGVGLSAAACGSDDSGDDTTAPTDAKVTLVINGLPPATEKATHDRFLANVAEFEKANPNIKIDAREGKMDPQTFPAKLAGGQLEDVFYVYFTDPASLIAKRQVVGHHASTSRTSRSPSEIKPELLQVFQDDDGEIYGLPYEELLDGPALQPRPVHQGRARPEQPAEDLGRGPRRPPRRSPPWATAHVGYGDYSKSNTGGWHFTAELYSLGGDVAINDGGTWKAAFNNAQGKQVLQQLKDMRWTDNIMGEKQLLEWADLLQHDGRAASSACTWPPPDNIPTIVNQYKGKYETYGLGPIPDGKGTLGGGEGYMFKAGLSPEKIKAGLKWLTFWFTSPDRIADGEQVGRGEQAAGRPARAGHLHRRRGGRSRTAADKQYANVPQENYAPFVDGDASIPVKLEPPNAQQIYAVLDVRDAEGADRQERQHRPAARRRRDPGQPHPGRRQVVKPGRRRAAHSPAGGLAASHRGSKGRHDGGTHGGAGAGVPHGTACAGGSRTTSWRTRSWRRGIALLRALLVVPAGHAA